MFIPVPSEDVAKSFAKAVYSLLRPVRNPQDTTIYAFGWVIHPETQAVALDYYHIEPLLLTPQVVSDSEMAQVLNQFISNGIVTLGDSTTILEFIEANLQLVVSVFDVTPASWLSDGFTLEQATADGWFPVYDV